MSFRTIGTLYSIKRCLTMVTHVRSVCSLARHCLWSQQKPFYTSTPHNMHKLNCRSYRFNTGFETETAAVELKEYEDELELEQGNEDDLYAGPYDSDEHYELHEETDSYVDALTWIYDGMFVRIGKSEKAKKILEFIEMEKRKALHTEHMPVDFTVLVSDSVDIKQLESLNIKAIKKGSPNYADVEEEILVVDPREMPWEPPKRNMDILENEVYQQMSKLLDMVTRDISKHKTADENMLVPPRENDPPTDMHGVSISSEVITNDDIVSTMRYGLVNKWTNPYGKDGFRKFLEMVTRVLADHMLKAKIKPEDYVVKFQLQNLGGTKSENTVNTRSAHTGFAYSKLEEEYIVNGVDLTRSEEGDSTELDIKVANIRSKLRWSEGGDTPFYRRKYIPDSRLFITQKSVTEMKQTRVGLVVGEVKSEEQPVSVSGIFERDPSCLKQAWNQSLLGLLYGNETATLVMSPKFAIFMKIQAKDGFVVTSLKHYKVMNPSTGIPDPEVFQKLFADLVLYMWNAFFYDFKH